MLCQSNDLHQLISQGETTCRYDLNGNMIQKTAPEGTCNLSYDALNQLKSAETETSRIKFEYDPLGRRVSRTAYHRIEDRWEKATQENYLYDGMNDIGAFDSSGLKQLRILGLAAHESLPRTVAIELNGQVFAALSDSQDNIHELIDPQTREMASHYAFTAFGEPLTHTERSPFNPWRFASKRLDPELSLIDFGKRLYDPSIARWLTTDPAGSLDSVNPYQYALNNPFRYIDPVGEDLLGFACGIGQICLGVAIIGTGVGLEIASCGGYTFAIGFHESLGIALVASGSTQAVCSIEGSRSERRGSYNYPWSMRGDYSSEHPIEYYITKEEEQGNQSDRPPYSGAELGDDPARCPGEGFEWKGKGEPGSKQGSWFNKPKGEGLRADLDHPPPVKPHWDYENSAGRKARLYLDGSSKWKNE